MNNIPQVAPAHQTLCSPKEKIGKNECSQPNEKDDAITQIKGIFSSSCRRKESKEGTEAVLCYTPQDFHCFIQISEENDDQKQIYKKKMEVKIFFFSFLSQRASLIMPEDLLFPG
jgi:hypothetical protein